MLLFLFLSVDFYLIPAAITQVFYPIADLVIPIETPSKEAKSEMQLHPVIVEITISEWSI